MSRIKWANTCAQLIPCASMAPKPNAMRKRYAETHPRNFRCTNLKMFSNFGYHTQGGNMGMGASSTNELPSTHSKISIDDIIIALQNSKHDKTQLEKSVAEYKLKQPKPVDLRSPHTFIVAHKVFASGNVWQPDTPILPNETIAKAEMRHLQQGSVETKYFICQLDWTIMPQEEKIMPTYEQFTWDYGDEENETTFLNEGNNNNADERRFVYCPRENTQ